MYQSRLQKILRGHLRKTETNGEVWSTEDGTPSRKSGRVTEGLYRG